VLEAEALQVALKMLDEEFGNIPNALYRTYTHFRARFINAYSTAATLDELLTDARQLEAYANARWATAIRVATAQGS
jgi:hypothetical protein